MSDYENMSAPRAEVINSGIVLYKFSAMGTSFKCVQSSVMYRDASFLPRVPANVGCRNSEPRTRSSRTKSRPLSYRFHKQMTRLLQGGLHHRSEFACLLKCTRKTFLKTEATSLLAEILTSGSLDASQTTCENSNHVENSGSSIREILVELRNGVAGDGKLVFPLTVTAKERRRAHEIAERLGLGHVSVAQGKERCFTAWRLSVAERLEIFRKLLDLEEAASRASFALEQPFQSWKVLEAQGLLLYKASVLEKDAASFGRERWMLEDGVGAERAGHVARFAQRARPGVAIRIAEKDAAGSWVVAERQPPARVAWNRGGKISVVFDYPPTVSDDSKEVCMLRVPDSTSFDRMRSVIGECERAEMGMKWLLNALLGDGISFASGVRLSEEVGSKFTPSPAIADKENASEREEEFDQGLNAEQRAAVELCTRSNTSPVVLIHGPFGTGKTRTLVEVVLQHVKSGRRVLVCTASNAAVDNMALALLRADPSLPLARAGVTERVATSVAAHTLEALQEAQPEAAVARKLRREAFSMQLTAQKWTRAADGGERRRTARKEANALFKDARRLDQVCAAAVLSRTKVLCGTLTGFASSLQDFGNSEDTRFDCVVVDEASQVINPALLLVLPYLKYPDNIANGATFPIVIMAGDHQQLPPTVLSEDVDDKGGGLEATLFEELMERDGGGLGTRLEELITTLESWDLAKLSILNQAHAIATGMESSTSSKWERLKTVSRTAALRQQYRMPVQLMAFPSAVFYGGELVARHSSSEKLVSTADAVFTLLDPGLLLEVIDTAGAGFEEEKCGDTSGILSNSSAAADVYSLSNSGQANLTARVVRELLMSKQCSEGEIGVVTPYSAEVMLLRELMAEAVKAGLEIDSVDAFQGREKDTIIFDTVRSNVDGTVGFLSDFHRLNVGITRARQKLIVIGDSATLSTDKIWALFFEWISVYRERPETRIRYRSVFEIPCEDGW
ncbi:hypothetical protein R1flu_024849 [Riccia fluitans]|uniref:R3H domain-containing protein n=1 Tax=Riccia fluitans TaxID=41844 RepID=A0ABD1XW32_9MARC